MSDLEQLEGGAYEVIRARLEKHGEELRERLSALDVDRKAVFGAVAPALVATDRIVSAHNCIPRDMVELVEGRFLFGYNIQFGLKNTTDISDVFSVYHYDAETHHFTTTEAPGLDDPRFAEDFKALYKYYRETVFVKFMKIGGFLYMGMRSGKAITDVKTFKWFVEDSGKLRYEGNRSDHEYVFPDQHDFRWNRAHREMHRSGEHPHISIKDRLFVETVGGDLTVKIEDNTASGQGIYAEDVTEDDQTLDDAEIFFAEVGNALILLKILPYREVDYRYLVFNEKMSTVQRVDSIADSCVLLPDSHGLIVPDGIILETGEVKRFDTGLREMIFERRIMAANGEDYLYVFYNRSSGDYVLFSYNLIAQRVDTPILCHGYSLFPDGRLIYFKADQHPQKHHTLQVWQTPYTAEQAVVDESSYLTKLGNAEVVRAMAECHEILTLLHKDDSYAGLYIDIEKKAGNITDSYFWVGQKEAHELSAPLGAIRGAAAAAISEFDKVVALRRTANERTVDVQERVRKLVNSVARTAPNEIAGHVESLAGLRQIRGEVIELKDVRYTDLPVVEGLEAQVLEATGKASERCVSFLLQDDSLKPYRDRVEAASARVPVVAKVAEAEEVSVELTAAGGELEMLIEIVSNLKIEDATQTTRIIDDISRVYARLNQVKVELKNRRSELAKSEGAAQFGAQLNLLNQAVVNYLDLCDSPEKCDDYQTRAMVQLEELEGKFGDFDEYLEELTSRRDDIYGSFETRKQQLLDQRGKRASALAKSADRLLSGVRSRVESLGSTAEISGYLAGDLMVDKVRNIVEELRKIGEDIKADEVATRLKTLKEDAVRGLRDKQDLYADGGKVVSLGGKKFTVNTQALELSIVPHDETMCYHLSGTAYFEPVTNDVFLADTRFFDQLTVAEDGNVYAAEYLAYQFYKQHPEAPENLLTALQGFMAPRFHEGYTKGVHDEDAAKILHALYPVASQAGLLRFPAMDRALALIAWEANPDEDLAVQLSSVGKARAAFGGGDDAAPYIERLRVLVASGFQLEGANVGSAAEYLYEEFVGGSGSKVVTLSASELIKAFKKALTGKRAASNFEEATSALSVGQKFGLIRDWLRVYARATQGAELDFAILTEAAAHLAVGTDLKGTKSVELATALSGLLGSHQRIGSGKYEFHFTQFLARLRDYAEETVPAYERFGALKHELIATQRADLRLNEFKPRVLTSFVRNRLLDEVYLPLVGTNLAKQIGEAGEAGRTDRMGLLLLVSPPGYGKTTLMEYIADKLGITFVKINGPALGHSVTSLDPAEAPNASAREEVEKLNLSFEMGDNVLLYIDDIQHCHSEFLQKFISLCDGQRRIEGVYKGKAKTYDLRGRKFAVVMSGNPYTETGGKFQIPDMLANRADTYNLGDIIGGKAEAFKQSYLENAGTSNATLGKLAVHGRTELEAAIRLTIEGAGSGVDFAGNYSAEETEEITSVVKKLMRVRDTILRVNLAYIESAAQADNYRTEPGFKLQGSYRNMNRIAERVLPMMTAAEVDALVLDHYRNESQTLTDGAEANLLKFKELEGILNEDEAKRWDEIKREFRRRLTMGGGDDDPVARIAGPLASLGQGIERIGTHLSQPAPLAEKSIEQLTQIISALRAVPVDVQINVLPVEEANPSKRVNQETELPIEVESEVKQGESPR